MKKVLVVDDDQAILEAIGIVLEGEGYSVKQVMEADKAMSAVREYEPDIIFLDLLLSGNEGTEIAEQIKSDDSLCDTPVVLISAHPSAERTAGECGADIFLAKPFELAELIQIVEDNT